MTLSLILFTGWLERKDCDRYTGPSSWDFSTNQFSILNNSCKFQWIPNILNLNADIMNLCAYERI